MSIRKVLKEECGPNPEDAATWLAAETGGAVIVAGKILDKGDHFVIPVFSADGKSEFRGNGGAAAGRQMFQVLRPGVATDGTKFQRQFTEFKFPISLQIEDGSLFSATIPQSDTIDPTSIVVETGPQAELERKRFESEGGPEAEVKGWTTRTGNPKYSGAQPDSGKFSHPQKHDKKEI